MAKLKFNEIDILDGKYEYFKVDRKDFKKMLIYYDLIYKAIKSKKPIKKKVFDNLMKIFVPVEIEKEKQYQQTFNSHKRAIMERFNNDKHYSFTEINKTNNEIVNSLEAAISIALSNALEKELLYDNNTKESCIEACYMALVDYKSKVKPENCKKYLTHGKMTTIAGFIAMQLGYHLSSELNSIKNSEIKHDTIYHTNKLKKHK